MRKLNLSVPELSQDNNYVSVAIKYERLAKSETLIMEYLEKTSRLRIRLREKFALLVQKMSSKTSSSS
jgi:hypothetical protein